MTVEMISQPCEHLVCGLSVVLAVNWSQPYLNSLKSHVRELNLIKKLYVTSKGDAQCQMFLDVVTVELSSGKRKFRDIKLSELICS